MVWAEITDEAVEAARQAVGRLPRRGSSRRGPTPVRTGAGARTCGGEPAHGGAGAGPRGGRVGPRHGDRRRGRGRQDHPAGRGRLARRRARRRAARRRAGGRLQPGRGGPSDGAAAGAVRRPRRRARDRPARPGPLGRLGGHLPRPRRADRAREPVPRRGRPGIRRARRDRGGRAPEQALDEAMAATLADPGFLDLVTDATSLDGSATPPRTSTSACGPPATSGRGSSCRRRRGPDGQRAELEAAGREAAAHPDARDDHREQPSAGERASCRRGRAEAATARAELQGASGRSPSRRTPRPPRSRGAARPGGARAAARLRGEPRALRGALRGAQARARRARLRGPAARGAAGAARRLPLRFRRVYVDEFQDANALQAEIVDLLAAERTVVVGDGCQAIYGFRHADVEHFMRRAGNPPEVTLRDNHRSQEPLLRALNGLLGAALRDEPAFAPLPPRGGPARPGARGRAPRGDRRRLGGRRQGDARAGGRGGRRPGRRAGRARLRLARDRRAVPLADRGGAVPGGARRARHPRLPGGRARLLRPRPGRRHPRPAGAGGEPLRRGGPGAGARVAVRRRRRTTTWWRCAAARATRAGAGRRGGAGPAARALDATRPALEAAEALRPLLRERGLPGLVEAAAAARGYDLAVLGLPDGARRHANLRKLVRMAADFAAVRGPDLRGFLAMLGRDGRGRRPGPRRGHRGRPRPRRGAPRDGPRREGAGVPGRRARRRLARPPRPTRPC